MIQKKIISIVVFFSNYLLYCFYVNSMEPNKELLYRSFRLELDFKKALFTTKPQKNLYEIFIFPTEEIIKKQLQNHQLLANNILIEGWLIDDVSKQFSNKQISFIKIEEDIENLLIAKYSEPYCDLFLKNQNAIVFNITHALRDCAQERKNS